MSAERYPAAVIAGAKRLHLAHELRRKGPWRNVLTPWQFLTDDHRGEYLKVADDIHAALYAADNDPTGAAEALAAQYHAGRDGPEVVAYWHDRLTEYLEKDN